MNTAIDTFTSALIRTCGDELTAVYTYNAAPDETLLLVPAGGGDIHRMRAIYWEQGGRSPAPIIVPQSILARQVRLFPLWAQTVQACDCLHGTPLVVEETAVESTPHWAQEAMDASAALSNPAAMGRLQLLARQLLGREVAVEETAVSLLAAIQRDLIRQMDERGVPAWQSDRPAADAVLPGLIAGYRLMGAMVYVFDDSLPDLLEQIDSETLLAALEQPSDGVRLVTARQLRLLLQQESAAAFILQNYVHVWGDDPLAGLSPDRKIVFRDAARKTAVLRTNTFIHEYFTMSNSDDEAMHTLIHDFQNKLLNVQLEHELLYRLLAFDRFSIPDLPPRTDPAVARLDAIFEQLDWWSAQYSAKMEAA